jgi:hypothetical protein
MNTKLCMVKHAVVLSKCEGLQKWLTPCVTDVHRVAHTSDVYILEQKAARQTKMMM